MDSISTVKDSIIRNYKNIEIVIANNNVGIGPAAHSELQEFLKSGQNNMKDSGKMLQLKQRKAGIVHMHYNNIRLSSLRKKKDFHTKYHEQVQTAISREKIQQNYLHNIFHVEKKFLERIIDLSAQRREEIDTVIKQNCTEYTFFKDFFGSAYDIVLSRSGRIFDEIREMDHLVIAEAATYALVNETSVHIITGDIDFTRIFDVARSHLKNVKNCIDILGSRDFEITLYKRFNPNKKYERIDILPIKRLECINGKLGFVDRASLI